MRRIEVLKNKASKMSYYPTSDDVIYLLDKLEVAEKALEFYVNTQNWFYTDLLRAQRVYSKIEGFDLAEFDGSLFGGRRARTALKQINEGEGNEIQKEAGSY